MSNIQSLAISSDNEIKIAAAVILDQCGRLLLVRKHGTKSFMQPGGKLEENEKATACLIRELEEELGLIVEESQLRELGIFKAPAANEVNTLVIANLFHMQAKEKVEARAEIEELIWFDHQAKPSVILAPLTKNHVLPLLPSLRG